MKAKSISNVEKNLMTSGSIWKTILLFSLPLIFGNLLQQTYNTIDSMIVGNYVGSNALAAVGSSTHLINLLISFSQGIAVGCGVLVSQSMGGSNQKNMRLAVHTSLALAVAFGLLISIMGYIFAPWLLEKMDTPAEVMGESIAYLRFFSFGLVFNIIYNMEAGILNAVGNSKRSLLYLGIASFTNVILDFLLIKRFGMGVKGAAIATNISQALSALLALLFLIRVPDIYKVHLSRIRIHKDMVLNILKVGVPTAIQNTVISLSNVIMQSSVNVFGALPMAGFGAFVKIDGFNILPVLSLSMAITTFVGQNYGAGQIERIKKGMWTTLAMTVFYTIISGTLLYNFAPKLIGLFTNDVRVIEAGVLASRFFCPFYFLLAIMHSLAGTVRGTGKTIPPMIILILSLCIFRILAAKFVIPHYNTIENVYKLYPISWVIGVILMVAYTLKADWLGEK
ncbi:MATE family efflux transporter [Peptoniphilus harei]|uniref:Staphylococcal virulence regulator protein A n=1 Tax=Peptoniphilus harei TaxID=54005 RepID=A0A2X1YG51_9FIRM|nr:MATE family efflux transporter [Peptoniphilus harei]QQT91521.1 MATE family efflux transporter [Peptoniphilus harei]SPY46481.1 Staphylococcal virulence regulator protein A [Peptoniphilus harei]